MEKKISEMTNEEILRRQLELIAERAEQCENNCLTEITNSMIDLYSVLEPKDSSVL